MIGQRANASQIPGYTGHQKTFEEVDQSANRAPGAQIPGKLTLSKSNLTLCPGYAGYIPGVSCENEYGRRYAELTKASATGAIPRGIDQNAALKFSTTSRREYQ